jgi:MGT family glycosyltransferase
MRVLFTLLPGTGPLHPLLPLASALRASGHEVALCSSAAFRSEVESHGLPFFDAGLDWHTSNPRYIEVLCEAAGGLTFPPLTGMERLAWVTDHLFIGGAARRMLPDVITIAGDWSADLVVRQALEFSGCVAAERLGLPHASVADAAHSALDLRHQVAEPLAGLRAEVGLPPDPDGEAVYPHLHLCFTPPRFDGPGASFPATARFLRHANAARPGEGLPAWVHELPDRPTVLVSMGTVFHRSVGLYEAIVEGLREEAVNLLVAIGFDQDPARLGPQPANVRIEPYLPLALLLAHCDLLVTHGGFNSIKEAMAAGVPMVIIPISGDQPYAAERCETLGVAVAVRPDERTAPRVQEAARAVLTNPSYRIEARRMQRDMEALPGIDHGVHLLEALHEADREAQLRGRR